MPNDIMHYTTPSTKYRKTKLFFLFSAKIPHVRGCVVAIKDYYLIMKVRHFAFNMKKKTFNAHLPESSIVVTLKSETLCARANFLRACANNFDFK